MKYLYFTDPHVKGRSPSGRLDEYPKTILRKLNEVIEIGNDSKVEAILCGGDLFDTPRVSFNLIGDLAEILSKSTVPIYVVPGNHDIFGYNIDSLPHTALGLLARMGVVKILTRDNPIVTKDFSFEGQPYYLGIDKDNKEKDYSVHSTANYRVLMPHSMLLPKPFHPSVPCTTIKEVSEIPKMNRPDLILCSHYHPPFEHEEGGVKAVNPGSLGRLELTASNKRIPTCLLLEWNGSSMDVNHVPLKTAEPSEDVLNFAKKSKDQQEAVLLDNFHEHIEDVSQNTEETQAMNIAYEMAVDRDLVETFERLVDDTDAEGVVSDGYIPTNNRVHFTNIELNNFQSHSKTKVDYSEKSNAIVGPSDSGKTAIMRGIRWVLFNEPSGAEFMRYGATKTSVSLYTNTGYKITRYRTRSSAGGYEITHPNGETTTYEGIGREVPIEVTNITQIPLLKVGKSELTFQIARQLEGAFFLGMSGGDRAQWLGMLTGVNRLDDGIRNVNKELVRERANKKSAHESFVKTEMKLKDKNEKLRELQQRQGALTEMVDRLRQKQEQLEYIGDMVTKLEQARKTIAEAEEKVDKYGAKLKGLRENLTSLYENQRKLQDIENIFAKVEKVKESKKKLRKLPILQKQIPHLKRKLSALRSTQEQMDLIAQAGKKLAEFDKLNEKTVEQQGVVKETLKKLHHDRHELVGDECPVCHQAIFNVK